MFDLLKIERWFEEKGEIGDFGYKLLMSGVMVMMNHEFHEVVAGIGVERTEIALFVDVIDGLLGVALEEEMAFWEEEEMVEDVVDLAGGLVESADDGAALFGHLFEEEHDLQGGLGVEAGRGLVQEQDARLAQQLHSDRHPFPLPPAHPPHEVPPDQSLLTLLQSQVHNQSAHSLHFLLSPHSRQSQVRAEHQRLPHSQTPEQYVILHHVSHSVPQALQAIHSRSVHA